MGKFYAVRKGRTTGIFLTWPQCQNEIKGFSGAEYKSFKTKEEAEEYLEGGNSSKNKKIDLKGLSAYVDGSFHKDKKIYGSGVVLLKDDKVIEEISFRGENDSLVDMRNVAGEIKAAEKAMDYAVKNNFKTLNLYYDYEGIEKWCTGAWEAKKKGTQDYRDFYKNIKEELDVNFVKVRAHTGDLYNEKADELAKRSIF